MKKRKPNGYWTYGRCFDEAGIEVNYTNQ